MPSTLLKAFLFLPLSLLASPRGPWGIGAVDDWASSGNYLIYSCASQAPAVENLLSLTYLYLQTALLSTNSPAYKAFFRNVDPAATGRVLRAITAGGNLTTTKHGSSRPTVVCVNDRDPGISNFWHRCQQPGHTILMQPPGTAVVLLCPDFFKLRPSPVSADCATVNHASTQLIGHSHIHATQYGYLVLGLADIYLRAMTDGELPMRQERDVNACLALPPDQALKNPSNYAFYASGKCSLFMIPL